MGPQLAAGTLWSAAHVFRLLGTVEVIKTTWHMIKLDEQPGKLLERAVNSVAYLALGFLVAHFAALAGAQPALVVTVLSYFDFGGPLNDQMGQLWGAYIPKVVDFVRSFYWY